MMQERLGIPACFSSGEKEIDDCVAISRPGQSVLESVYRTKIADQCRSITITWCKNLLLHGLSVSVQGRGGESQYTCKVELKPWYFWKKQGSKRFLVDGRPVDIFWDLKKVARFHGETEPASDYYVAIVCDGEVVLLLGNLKKEAYRKTKCRPALLDPILVSRKEHLCGKKKFITRVKFHDKGSFHEIAIECKNRSCSNGVEPEMEIRADGVLAIHVKRLQWKFRGNDSINLNKAIIEVYWDVHDWLFCPGLRHGLFIFKPALLPEPSPTFSKPPSLPASPLLSSQTAAPGSVEGATADFCLFLYAWKVE